MAMTTNGNGVPIATEPNELPLYAPKPPVARINRRTVMGAGVLAAALAVVVLVLGFSDHRGQRLPGEDRENSQHPNGPLDATRDLPKDYSFDVRQAAANVTYELPALAADAPPASAPAATRPTGPSAEELAAIAERQRLAELRRQLLEQQRKEMEQALDSPLLFANAKPTKLTGSTSSAPHDGDNSNITTAPPVGDASGIALMGAAYGPPVPDPNALIPPNIDAHERAAAGLITRVFGHGIDQTWHGRLLASLQDAVRISRANVSLRRLARSHLRANRPLPTCTKPLPF